jgi:phage minor structural protein
VVPLLIPKLYSADAFTFIDLLRDCTVCRVTEELNGSYELTAELPQTAENIANVLPGRYISAKPCDGGTAQLFRIYSVEKNLAGRLVIDAEHISYLLNAYPVDASSGTGLSCTAAMNLLLSRATAILGHDHGFTCWSNSTFQTALDLHAVSVRAGLGGTQGSVLQKFRVEYEWDGKIVRGWSRRGTDNGVKIAYKKNLTGLTASTSVDESYSGLFPFAKMDDAYVILPEKVLTVNAPGLAERYLVKDFSQELQGGGSEDDLRLAAQAWLNRNDIAAPALTLNVRFIDLSQSPEYAEYRDLERVKMGDTVHVRHEPLGISADARVTKTVYNSLTEQYDNITVGRVKADMGSTLQQLKDEIAAIDLDLPDMALIQQIINQAVSDATNAITGASGGKIILNPPQNPQELLILTDVNSSIQTAQKLWRFNSGGLGYSSTGYNGSFGTAITANGAIVADFITAGTLTANIIKAGILTDAAGKFSVNMATGAASLSGATISGGSVTITNGSRSTIIDANGLSTSYATITGGSVSIGGAAFRTEIAAGALSQYALGNGTFICGLTPFSAGSEYRPTIYIGSDSRVTGFSVAYESGGNIVNIAEFDKTEIDLLKPVVCENALTVAGGSGYGLRCDSGNTLYLTNPDSSRYITFRIGSTDRGYFYSGGLSVNGTVSCTNLSVSNPPWPISISLPSSPSFSGTVYGNRFSAYQDGQAYQINGYSMLDISSSGNIAVGGGLIGYGYPLNLHGGPYIRFLISGTERAYVSSSGVQNSSLAEQKSDIKTAESTLDIIQNATIYQYHYNAPRRARALCSLETPPETIAETPEPERLGFVIGDGYAAPPACVLAEDGNGVSLYSMAAVCWRGLQELLARVTNLEGA